MIDCKFKLNDKPMSILNAGQRHFPPSLTSGNTLTNGVPSALLAKGRSRRETTISLTGRLAACGERSRDCLANAAIGLPYTPLMGKLMTRRIVKK